MICGYPHRSRCLKWVHVAAPPLQGVTILFVPYVGPLPSKRNFRNTPERALFPMDKNPLLGAGERDGSIALPALQKLLQLAYSDNTDKQLEVGVFNTARVRGTLLLLLYITRIERDWESNPPRPCMPSLIPVYCVRCWVSQSPLEFAGARG